MKKQLTSYLFAFTIFILFICDAKSNDLKNNGDTLVLSLDDAIEHAVDSALDAFIAENLYLAAYWQHENFRAERLPFLNLNATPADYRRTVAQEYDPQEESYRYIERETFFSSANLSVNQNIFRTGGEIYLDSDIGRLENLGIHERVEYSTVPLRIGVRQPIFAYNEFKWKKKIEPVKYERARFEMIESMEGIAMEVVELFFELAVARENLQIAQTQKANADTLHNIGKQRFDLGTISREDLYMLELDKVESGTYLERAKAQLERAQMNLLSYLRLDADTNIEIVVPEDVPDIQIQPSQSLGHAQEKHPKMLELEEDILMARSEVERARKESRFNANLDLSFGLNQRAENLPGAYQDPTNQQIVNLGVSIPLLDWGTAKGEHQLAKHNRQVVSAQVEQAEIDFIQNVILITEEFNRQKKYVEDAAVVDSIADKAYELTLDRFISGQADIIRLQNAQQSSESASVNYLETLKDYWYYYYNMRRMTLYDFLNDKCLTDDFEENLGVDF